MKLVKYILLVGVALAFAIEAKGQELPPAANWIGLPYSSFDQTNLKEIGIAVGIDCEGKYLSKYGRNFPLYDKKCYQWKRSEYKVNGKQSYEASLCFVAHFRHERLIMSDDQSLVLLADKKGEVLAVSSFSKESAGQTSLISKEHREKMGWDERALVLKYQPISLIDCKSRDLLDNSPGLWARIMCLYKRHKHGNLYCDH